MTPTTGGTWAIVDTKSVSFGNSSSVTVVSPVFAAGAAQGDLVVGIIAWDPGAGDTISLSSVTDNGTGTSNTWNVVGGTSMTIGQQRAAAIWCVNQRNAGTLTTVTGTFSTSTPWRAILVREYSGNAASPLDGSNTSGPTTHTQATDNLTSGTFTPAVDGGLVVGLNYYYAVNGTLAAGTGFGNFTEETAFVHLAIEHFIQTTAAQTAVTFTDAGGTSGRENITFGFAFKKQ